ncbi:LamG-like jellyroll fold domain-containing protein [Kitasatospora phosalacinea]|uniref:LamG-like jellyroll fold domain-containing protein n=1 Tax=Kitasatospora phosalacinea TaxID=2065 RepID=UPI00365EA41A
MLVPPQETAETLAVAEAKRTGKPVEVEALKDESSDVVAQPDGQLVSTTYVQPKRVRKAGRGWVDIDTTLVALPSGAVAPKAATTDVEFSGGGSGQPLVRMARAGKELKLTWPKALPKPVLDGQTAEYRSILPDVDLKLTASATGFSQILVVHTPQAAKNPELDALRLGLQGDGLEVRQEADGSLKAVDPVGGGTVFEAPTPVMWDSSAPAAGAAEQAAQAPAGKSKSLAAPSAASEAPGEGARTARLKVDLPEDGMVLTPDQGMLDDPSTVFPVMIDPMWDTPPLAGWAGVSRYYPNQTYWHFTYGGYVPDWGVGYCGDTSKCAPTDVKRAFFQVPTGKFIGKQILKATFDTWESHSYSCSARPVELWNTGYIDSGLTWNKQNAAGFWSRKLQTITTAKGYSGCDAGWLEWGGDANAGVKNLVQDGANWGWQYTTFGLKAQDESDLNGWKRFTDGAYLQVYYNLAPSQIAMSDMTMSPGSVCQYPAIALNKVPQVTVNRASDPDGDPVAVQFAVSWDDGTGLNRHWWSTGAEGNTPTDFKASGSQFTYQLPASLPQGKQLDWEARSWDGASWGPWSSDGDPTACYFSIDTSVPAGPDITSGSYPGSKDATAPLPWTDGVGKYGSFTLKAATTTVTKYQWSLDGSPFTDLPTTNGAAQTVNVLPQTPGLHVLSAMAVNAASTGSQPEAYYFNVLNGQGQRTGWTMDETSGTTLAGTGGSFELAPSSGASVTAAGHTGGALALDGTTTTGGAPNGYAETQGTVLDTTKGFTVSAWVNIADTTRNRVAVSQNGQQLSRIVLGLINGKWTMRTTDKDGAGYNTQVATSDAPVVAGQWTHLLGYYDPATQKIGLYVNGTAGTPVAAATPWQSSGPLEIGRSKYLGNWTDPWKGSVDDVELWDRPLNAAEAAKVAVGQPVTTGLGAKALWNFDGTGTAALTGTGEADALTAYNGVQLGAPGSAGKAVHLDGTDDYLRSSRPQVDGTRDFSVSAWVKLPQLADTDTTPRFVISQAGQHNSEFFLFYSAAAKRWGFGRYGEDTATAAQTRAWQPDCTTGTFLNGVPCIGPNTGGWTHLIGVNDTTAKKIRLYVNGYLVGESDYTQNSPWATPGPLQIGAGNREGANVEFFGGDVDDVRVFDRVVTTPEAAAMVQQRPLLVGRWKLNTSASGTTPGEGPAAMAATLGSGATIDPDGWGMLLTPGFLQLDGATGYAATSAAPLRTNQSFTLAGWANTAGIPTRDMTVLSLPGTNNSAVTMRWHSLGLDANSQPVGEWQAEVRTSDANGSPRTLVAHTPQYSVWENWTHLTLSYDSFTRRLVLYVNGQEENQTCEAGATDCVAHVSSAGAPQPYEASGSLQFGRNRASGAWSEYFSGQLDDVWAYQGVLSADQVYALASSIDELPTPTP